MNFVKDAWDVIWDVLGWFQIITFLDEWEEGIVLQTGKFRRTLKPGWWLHLPFGIDEVHTMNVKPDALELAEQSLTTLDLKKIVCRAVMMWSIFDIKKCIIDVEDAADTLGDIALGFIQEMVEETEWDDIRTKSFRKELKLRIQQQARKFGITVSTVKFQDLAEARSIRLFGGFG